MVAGGREEADAPKAVVAAQSVGPVVSEARVRLGGGAEGWAPCHRSTASQASSLLPRVPGFTRGRAAL